MDRSVKDKYSWSDGDVQILSEKEYEELVNKKTDEDSEKDKNSK